jgi:terminal uridylyltransferase
MVQIEHLDRLAAEEIPKVEMSLAEFEEKEAFRAQLEGTFRQAFAEGYPSTGDIATISLVGFGSLASGFGMPGSDMDLAVVPGWKDPSRADQIGIDRDIPRLLERAVLDAKMGGRLLTRTRVPILKVCEKPTDELYTALYEERKKWDDLPPAEQYPTDLSPIDALPPGRQLKRSQLVASGLYPPPKPVDTLPPADKPISGDDFPELGTGADKKKKKAAPKPPTQVEAKKPESLATTVESPGEEPATESIPKKQQGQQPRGDKGWMREKVLGPLDFPKDGVGIQCDINFENPLGIHNTHMLRCYSMADPRVRPIVLFVKSWAKRRKINSSYSGTLNSYGWVLMVLHYLVNIAQPPVCPNLQHSIPKPTDLGQLENFFKDPIVSGYIVRFWRNEQEIMQAAQSGQLTNNRQSVGELLRGFFQYYASLSSYNNYGPRPPQFYWTNEVLSLRTPGGIRSKQDKGWVSAKTTITAEKKVTNRYLFAIEDPFELDHNVARTVTHRGIVAIRDEFRRAWRILGAIGKGMEPQEGGIFDEVVEGAPQTKESADEMWKEIVSPRPTEDGVQAATTESATTESATTEPVVAV